MSSALLSAINIYPVKSCAGIALVRSELRSTGLAHDRDWMLVDEQGRFISQREMPRLALVKPQLADGRLQLDAPGMSSLSIAPAKRISMDVLVWQDRCAAWDEGTEAADWFSHYLKRPVRLVRFDDRKERFSNRAWTGAIDATTHFADGFAVLVISEASLADLNTRLTTPVPMSRFRPNFVLTGIAAYDEDRVHELRSESLALRIVKPCTRCKITTIDQATAEATGDEPLQTLKSFRFSQDLRGVAFGQNAIVVAGDGVTVRVGQTFEISWKAS